MSKKFTEEQFKKLVKIQEKYFSNNLLTYGIDGENPNQAISEYDNKLRLFIWVEDLLNEAIAIMNPVTREWAHEQFVEKEKKYVWRLKTNNKLVISKMFDSWFVDGAPSGKLYFSEKEINNSPLKPEWFDKEEV